MNAQKCSYFEESVRPRSVSTEKTSARQYKKRFLNSFISPGPHSVDITNLEVMTALSKNCGMLLNVDKSIKNELTAEINTI